MIRTLLATTAIATLVASGALAQSMTPTDPAATPGAEQTEMTIHAEGHLASDVIGESVYNGTGEEAENIGQVTDLVISPDGNVEAIVVGVGGFLGIGQKEVALEYDLAEWSEQQDGERWLVVETTKEALEAQEEFDRSAYRPMPADAQVTATQPVTKEDLANAPAGQEGADAGGETAMAPADETGAPAADDGAADAGGMAAIPTDDGSLENEAGQETAATPDTESADQTAQSGLPDEQPDDQQTAAQTEQRDAAGDQQQAQADQQSEDGAAADTDQTLTGAVDPSQLQEAEPDQIRAENLTGTAVYGANDEHVGEIGDVILTPEGDVDAVIVDVGGFLGIGEKEVAIGTDDLAFMTDEDGDLYLFTHFSQEQLEAAPEYDEAAYAEQRDEMRLQAE